MMTRPTMSTNAQPNNFFPQSSLNFSWKTVIKKHTQLKMHV